MTSHNKTRGHTLFPLRNVVWRAFSLTSLQTTVDTVGTGPHGRRFDMPLAETDEDESRFVRCHPPSILATRLTTQSTTTTAFGGSEVQHVAASATQDVFSETVGNEDELGRCATRNSGHVWIMEEHHLFHRSKNDPRVFWSSGGKERVWSALTFRSTLSACL